VYRDVTGREPGGFEEFFDETYARTLAVSRRLVGDPHLAEDLAAEALARAYARWRSVRRHPAPDAWVLRTATNLAIDALRRGRATPEPAAATDAADLVALRLALAGALRSLSPRQRQIVVLRYLADLSEQEVADTLSLSPGAVKTHLSRGLVNLRRLLGPEHPEVADALGSI
jgi:RNA polymerase sigma-70 factor (sigma-E family)